MPGYYCLAGGIIFWRFTSFLNKDAYADQFYTFLVVCTAIWIRFTVKMTVGARKMTLEIKKFQQTEQFCKENPDFVWESGKDVPNGFVLK